MNISKYIISSFVLLFLVSCGAPDIDKIASDYCECRKKEHFEGKVIGEQCFESWHGKYRDVKASKSEIAELEKRYVECNNQFSTNNNEASIQFAANEYCVCAHMESTGDTIESKFCFEEWNQKYKDAKLSEQEQKEFVQIITECTGIRDSITTSESLTIEMIAADYCRCIDLDQQNDTIASLSCYQERAMQYQGLQLTPEENIELKKILSDYAAKLKK